MLQYCHYYSLISLYYMLPIASLIPELVDKIVGNDCVLVAPPGAGKSTYLPLKLLNIPLFTDKVIIMLQPRQVAVRGIAQYLSAQLNQPLGATVGYQMRGESNYSDKTKLLIMTEGLLSARIQTDPELTNIGLIIFDEFHERSVFCDIALGLCIEVQQGLREDLRLLVMSATLDVKPVVELLQAPVILRSEGRVYPIGYHYRPVVLPIKNAYQQNKLARFTQHVLCVISEAYANHGGHILVFMPGANEINRLVQALEGQLPQAGDAPPCLICPLYGGLSSKAQQQAIDSPPNGTRKIVIATNIAETSLTIDGVSVVIDSGLEKVQSFNLSRKASQLSEQMISKASSTQRAGRAGRQQAGVCYRLWSEQQQQFLIEKSLPQITQVDISPYLLALTEWGTSFSQLPLIDKPSAAQIDYASEFLALLGFMSQEGVLSKEGRRAATLNTHPRLAKLLLHATSHVNPQYWYVFALLAAILEGKPLNRETNSINLQEQLLYLLRNQHHLLHKEGKRWLRAMQRIDKSVDHKSIKVNVNFDNADLISFIDSNEFIQGLLFVFPDRVAKRREHSSNVGQSAAYILANGVGVSFPFGLNELQQRQSQKDPPKQRNATSNLDYQWLICLDFAMQSNSGHRNINQNSNIRLFLPLTNAVISDYITHNKQVENKLIWDDSLLKISAIKVESLGAITLIKQKISLNDVSTSADQKQTQITSILLQQIEKQGIQSLLKKAESLINRTKLARAHVSSNQEALPDCSSAGLEANMQSWLGAYLTDISSWQQLIGLDWVQIIQSRLTWDQQQYLNKHYPTHFTAPSGNSHKLVYKGNGDVELSIRLQELYGLTDTPSVGHKHSPIAVMLRLLSPAQREIQKTKDLACFWVGSYKEVQKEMKGRYPKHFWPDTPASAKATTRVKKHM